MSTHTMLARMRPAALAALAALMAAAPLLGSSANPAESNPPAGAKAAAPARQNRPEKIRELVDYLGYGDEAKHTDAAIPALSADVAADDPSWNSTHRRWKAVGALIGKNLRTDAQSEFAQSEAAIVAAAVHAMSDGVVAEDLDSALAFFHSTTGRRFMDLQNSLIDLSIEVNLAKDTESGAVSAENLDARKRVLELWLPIVFVHSMLDPQSAYRATDAVYTKFSRLRGPQLDALAQRYADDLPQFEAFTQSVSVGRIIRALRSIGREVPPPNMAEFFAAEVKRHAAEWRAAYQGS